MRGMRVLCLIVASSAVVFGKANAQKRHYSFAQPAQRPPVVAKLQTGAATTGASAFGAEALGASVGSALGFGLVYLAKKDECDVEDLGCNIENVIGAMALGTAGAAVGDYLAGKLFDTEPSIGGAIVGAIAGAAAGLGTWHLFTEELDIVNKGEAATATYVITQGVVTALGSRLVRALK